jgi:hypothetical protein
MLLACLFSLVWMLVVVGAVGAIAGSKINKKMR